MHLILILCGEQLLAPCVILKVIADKSVKLLHVEVEFVQLRVIPKTSDSYVVYTHD